MRAPSADDVDVALAGLARLAAAGALRPVRPDRLAGMAVAALRFGASPATAYAAAARRHPDRVAVVDDDGTSTFRDVDRRAAGLAAGLARLGVRPGDAVALLARNSAAFVVAQAAATRLGADVVYLNTGFAGPALADVAARERVAAVVADVEFAEVVADGLADRPLVVAGGTGPLPARAVAYDALANGPIDGPAPWRSPRGSRHVILTSGTTGRPKGAGRALPGGAGALEPVAAVLSAIPLRARGTTVLAAPMFHAWGFLHLALAQLLDSTLVLSRRFDPAGTLELVQRHAADALVAVPVMAQRMLDLPGPGPDTSSLRVVALSGSALPPPLAARLTDRFGDVVYDLYGSTEVAYATVATPRDLREAPGSVGRVLPGVTVRIVDADGAEVAPGSTGRIFVGNRFMFAGYTGGGDKERLDGCVATGDVGHLDDDGRLWVAGRDDDMIVSGGENVFPAEVEECLLGHPAVADVTVVGVPDDEFGQRLVAHVVSRGSADADQLRDHVRRHLARYKVPRDVVFHDELPRNETGKVLKRALTAR